MWCCRDGKRDIQRVPIKGTLCNIRLWMMEFQLQYNHREYGHQSARLTHFTHLVQKFVVRYNIQIAISDNYHEYY